MGGDGQDGARILHKQRQVPRPEYGYSSRPTFDTKPGVFQEVCEEVYRVHVKKLIKTELEKTEWNEGWTSTGSPIVTSAIKEWLNENADKLLQTTLQQMFGQVAQQIVQGLRHA